MLAVQGDGRGVGGPHLQGEKGQVGLSKAAEHVQQLVRHPVAAGVGLHGDVVNIPLVQHHLEPRVAQHAALLRLGHDKAGLRIKEDLGEHGLAPGGGEALPLQGGDLFDVTAVHGHDVIFHENGTPFRPGSAGPNIS